MPDNSRMCGFCSVLHPKGSVGNEKKTREEHEVPGRKNDVLNGIDTVHGADMLKPDRDRGELSVACSRGGDAVGTRVDQNAEVGAALVRKVIILSAQDFESLYACGYVKLRTVVEYERVFVLRS